MNIPEFKKYFRNKLLEKDVSSEIIDIFLEPEISIYFPEIIRLIGCLQDPIWHPEGDVFTHTKLVFDKAVEISYDWSSDLREKILLFAICHDLGKPITTNFVDGRWRSPGHEIAGLPLTSEFLKKFDYQNELIDYIIKLVKDHLTIISLHKHKEMITDKAIIKLIQRVDVDFLVHCVKADYFGRNNKDEDLDNFPPEIWIKDRIKNLFLNQEKSTFLNGKILKSLNIQPGPIYKEILDKALKLEKEGIIKNSEDAIIWLNSWIQDRLI